MRKWIFRDHPKLGAKLDACMRSSFLTAVTISDGAILRQPDVPMARNYQVSVNKITSQQSAEIDFVSSL